MNTQQTSRDSGENRGRKALLPIGVAFPPEQFICPECGSREPASVRDASKWGAGMPRALICASCHFEIPAHLGERWGGISIEDARGEWREVYRALAKTSQTKAAL